MDIWRARCVQVSTASVRKGQKLTSVAPVSWTERCSQVVKISTARPKPSSKISPPPEVAKLTIASRLERQLALGPIIEPQDSSLQTSSPTSRGIILYRDAADLATRKVAVLEREITSVS